MIKHLKKHLLCILLFPFATFGDSAKLDSVMHWEDAPKLHTPYSIEAKEPAFVVHSNSVIIYEYNQVGYPLQKSVLHMIIHINESKSIEEFNKLYIPVEEESDLEKFKARTITANGKIIDIKRSDVKLITEEGRNYLTVPIEGLEIGSELEYVYSLKKNISFLGTYFIQSTVYSRESFFSILTPDNLVMKSKVYNSNQIPTDTILNNERSINYGFKKRYASTGREIFRSKCKSHSYRI
ncbi:MAG: DUF3857 domain-containing protein [Bacteroidetes bacterium]|nr:DUF3857 domain-containing protein [Bacteroidota bacterium]